MPSFAATTPKLPPPAVKTVQTDAQALESQSNKESKREYVAAGYGDEADRGVNAYRRARELAALSVSGNSGFAATVARRGAALLRYHRAQAKASRSNAGEQLVNQPPTEAVLSNSMQFTEQLGTASVLVLLEDAARREPALALRLLTEINQQLVQHRSGTLARAPNSSTGFVSIGDGLETFSKDTLNKLSDTLCRMALGSVPVGDGSSGHAKVAELVRLAALEAVVHLAAARRRLTDILRAIDLLLFVRPSAKLDVHAVLSAMSVASTGPSLPALLRGAHKGDFAVPSSFLFLGSQNSGAAKPMASRVKFLSVAGDGTYLYLHTNLGLTKLGTGARGTTPGSVYQHVAGFHSSTPSSMACYGKHLYLRMNSTPNKPDGAGAGAFLVVVSTGFLQEAGTVSLSASDAQSTNASPVAAMRIVQALADAEVDPALTARVCSAVAEATESTGADGATDAAVAAAASVLSGASWRIVGDGSMIMGLTSHNVMAKRGALPFQVARSAAALSSSAAAAAASEPTETKEEEDGAEPALESKAEAPAEPTPAAEEAAATPVAADDGDAEEDVSCGLTTLVLHGLQPGAALHGGKGGEKGMAHLSSLVLKTPVRGGLLGGSGYRKDFGTITTTAYVAAGGFGAQTTEGDDEEEEDVFASKKAALRAKKMARKRGKAAKQSSSPFSTSFQTNEQKVAGVRVPGAPHLRGHKNLTVEGWFRSAATASFGYKPFGSEDSSGGGAFASKSKGAADGDSSDGEGDADGAESKMKAINEASVWHGLSAEAKEGTVAPLFSVGPSAYGASKSNSKTETASLTVAVSGDKLHVAMKYHKGALPFPCAVPGLADDGASAGAQGASAGHTQKAERVFASVPLPESVLVSEDGKATEWMHVAFVADSAAGAWLLLLNGQEVWRLDSSAIDVVSSIASITQGEDMMDARPTKSSVEWSFGGQCSGTPKAQKLKALHIPQVAFARVWGVARSAETTAAQLKSGYGSALVAAQAAADTPSKDVVGPQGVAAPEDGLLGCWPMDEGFGTMVADVTPFRHHARMMGMAWLKHTEDVPVERPALKSLSALTKAASEGEGGAGGGTGSQAAIMVPYKLPLAAYARAQVLTNGECLALYVPAAYVRRSLGAQTDNAHGLYVMFDLSTGMCVSEHWVQHTAEGFGSAGAFVAPKSYYAVHLSNYAISLAITSPNSKRGIAARGTLPELGHSGIVPSAQLPFVGIAASPSPCPSRSSPSGIAVVQRSLYPAERAPVWASARSSAIAQDAPVLAELGQLFVQAAKGGDLSAGLAGMAQLLSSAQESSNTIADGLDELARANKQVSAARGALRTTLRAAIDATEASAGAAAEGADITAAVQESTVEGLKRVADNFPMYLGHYHKAVGGLPAHLQTVGVGGSTSLGVFPSGTQDSDPLDFSSQTGDAADMAALLGDAAVSNDPAADAEAAQMRALQDEWPLVPAAVAVHALVSHLMSTAAARSIALSQEISTVEANAAAAKAKQKAAGNKPKAPTPAPATGGGFSFGGAAGFGQSSAFGSSSFGGRASGGFGAGSSSFGNANGSNSSPFGKAPSGAQLPETLQMPSSMSYPSAVELSDEAFTVLRRVLSKLSAAYAASRDVDASAEAQLAEAAGADGVSGFARTALLNQALFACMKVFRCNLEHLVAWKMVPSRVGFSAGAVSNFAAEIASAIIPTASAAVGDARKALVAVQGGASSGSVLTAMLNTHLPLHMVLQAGDFDQRLRKADGASATAAATGLFVLAARQRYTGQLAKAPFVDTLKWLMEVTPASELSQQISAKLHEEIAESLSLGMPVFTNDISDRLRMLASLIKQALGAAPPTAGGAALADGGAQESKGGDAGAGTAGLFDGMVVQSSAADNEAKRSLREMLMARYLEAMAKPSAVNQLLAVLQRSGSSRSSAVFAPSCVPAPVLEALGMLGVEASGTGVADRDFELLMESATKLLLQFTETRILNTLAQSKSGDKKSAQEDNACGAAGDSTPEHISALANFVLQVQAVILAKALGNPRPRNPYFAYGMAFSHRMLASLAELVEFANASEQWPTSAADADADLLATKEAIVGVLQEQLGGILLSMLSVLSAMPASLLTACAVLPTLQRLLKAMDALALGLPEVVSAEAEAAQGKPQWMMTTKRVLLESAHPVPQGSTAGTISIPGAKNLLVKFDDDSFRNTNNSSFGGSSSGASGVSIALYYDKDMQHPVPNAVFTLPSGGAEATPSNGKKSMGGAPSSTSKSIDDLMPDMDAVGQGSGSESARVVFDEDVGEDDTKDAVVEEEEEEEKPYANASPRDTAICEAFEEGMLSISSVINTLHSVAGSALYYIDSCGYDPSDPARAITDSGYGQGLAFVLLHIMDHSGADLRAASQHGSFTEDAAAQALYALANDPSQGQVPSLENLLTNNIGISLNGVSMPSAAPVAAAGAGGHVPGALPAAGFRVTGDTVHVVYNTGYNSSCWGFRAAAAARVGMQVAALPWALDMHRSVALLAGRFAYTIAAGGCHDDNSNASDVLAAVTGAAAGASSGAGGAAADTAAFAGGADALTDSSAVLDATADGDVGLMSAAAEAAASAWLGSELCHGGMVLTTPERLLEAQHGAVFHKVVEALGGASAYASEGADVASETASGADGVHSTVMLVQDLAAVMKLARVRTDPFPVPADVREIVTDTITHMAAVLMHHNHLVPDARAYLASAKDAQTAHEADPAKAGKKFKPAAPPSTVSRAWQTAHRIKRSLRSKFQAHSLAITAAAKEALGGDGGEVQLEEGDVDVDRVSIYRDMCRDIKQRCELLLSFVPLPLPEAAPVPLALSRSSSSASAAQSGLESVAAEGEAAGSAEDDEAKRKARDAKAALMAWQALQRQGGHVSLATAAPEQRHGLVWRMAHSLVVETETPVPIVRAAVLSRRHRAALRVAGVNALHALLQSATLPSAQREVIAQAFPALCASESDAEAGAPALFLHGTSGAGEGLQVELQSAFVRLYGFFVKLLQWAGQDGGHSEGTGQGGIGGFGDSQADGPPTVTPLSVPLLQVALRSFALRYTAQQYGAVVDMGIYNTLFSLLRRIRAVTGVDEADEGTAPGAEKGADAHAGYASLQTSIWALLDLLSTSWLRLNPSTQSVLGAEGLESPDAVPPPPSAAPLSLQRSSSAGGSTISSGLAPVFRILITQVNAIAAHYSSAAALPGGVDASDLSAQAPADRVERLRSVLSTASLKALSSSLVSMGLKPMKQTPAARKAAAAAGEMSYEEAVAAKVGAANDDFGGVAPKDGAAAGGGGGKAGKAKEMTDDTGEQDEAGMYVDTFTIKLLNLLYTVVQLREGRDALLRAGTDHLLLAAIRKGIKHPDGAVPELTHSSGHPLAALFTVLRLGTPRARHVVARILRKLLARDDGSLSRAVARKRQKAGLTATVDAAAATALQTESDDCMLLSLGEVAGVERSTAGLESKTSAGSVGHGPLLATLSVLKRNAPTAWVSGEVTVLPLLALLGKGAVSHAAAAAGVSLPVLTASKHGVASLFVELREAAACGTGGVMPVFALVSLLRDLCEPSETWRGVVRACVTHALSHLPAVLGDLEEMSAAAAASPAAEGGFLLDSSAAGKLRAAQLYLVAGAMAVMGGSATPLIPGMPVFNKSALVTGSMPGLGSATGDVGVVEQPAGVVAVRRALDIGSADAPLLKGRGGGKSSSLGGATVGSQTDAAASGPSNSRLEQFTLLVSSGDASGRQGGDDGKLTASDVSAAAANADEGTIRRARVEEFVASPEVPVRLSWFVDASSEKSTALQLPELLGKLVNMVRSSRRVGNEVIAASGVSTSTSILHVPLSRLLLQSMEMLSMRLLHSMLHVPSLVPHLAAHGEAVPLLLQIAGIKKYEDKGGDSAGLEDDLTAKDALSCIAMSTSRVEDRLLAISAVLSRRMQVPLDVRVAMEAPAKAATSAKFGIVVGDFSLVEAETTAASGAPAGAAQREDGGVTESKSAPKPKKAPVPTGPMPEVDVHGSKYFGGEVCGQLSVAVKPVYPKKAKGTKSAGGKKTAASAQSQSTSTGGFGGGGFGGGGFGGPSTTSLGAPAKAGSSGQPTFGASPASGGFGSGGPASKAASGGFSFGDNASKSTGGGISFGDSTPGASGQGFSFGGLSAKASSGLLGGPASKASSGGFGFGGPAPDATGGSMGGSGGFGFGGPSPDAASGAFGGEQPAEPATEEAATPVADAVEEAEQAPADMSVEPVSWPESARFVYLPLAVKPSRNACEGAVVLMDTHVDTFRTRLMEAEAAGASAVVLSVHSLRLMADLGLNDMLAKLKARAEKAAAKAGAKKSADKSSKGAATAKAAPAGMTAMEKQQAALDAAGKDTDDTGAVQAAAAAFDAERELAALNEASRPAPDAAAFARLRVPVLCVDREVGTTLRKSLGVPEHEEPTVQHQAMMLATLQEEGYPADLCEKAWRNSGGDLDAARTWLASNASWMMEQKNLMAELEEDVAKEATKARKGRGKRGAAAGGAAVAETEDDLAEKAHAALKAAVGAPGMRPGMEDDFAGLDFGGDDGDAGEDDEEAREEALIVSYMGIANELLAMIGCKPVDVAEFRDMCDGITVADAPFIVLEAVEMAAEELDMNGDEDEKESVGGMAMEILEQRLGGEAPDKYVERRVAEVFAASEKAAKQGKKRKAAADKSADELTWVDVLSSADIGESARERVAVDEDWPVARRFAAFNQGGSEPNFDSAKDSAMGGAQGSATWALSGPTQLYEDEAFLGSLAKKSTHELVSMLSRTYAQASMHYARRCLMAAFTYWPNPSHALAVNEAVAPAAVPVKQLPSLQSLCGPTLLRYVMHVGLATQPYPAASPVPEWINAVSVAQSGVDISGAHAGAVVEMPWAPPFATHLEQVLVAEAVGYGGNAEYKPSEQHVSRVILKDCMSTMKAVRAEGMAVDVASGAGKKALKEARAARLAAQRKADKGRAEDSSADASGAAVPMKMASKSPFGARPTSAPPTAAESDSDAEDDGLDVTPPDQDKSSGSSEFAVLAVRPFIDSGHGGVTNPNGPTRICVPGASSLHLRFNAPEGAEAALGGAGGDDEEDEQKKGGAADGESLLAEAQRAFGVQTTSAGGDDEGGAAASSGARATGGAAPRPAGMGGGGFSFGNSGGFGQSSFGNNFGGGGFGSSFGRPAATSGGPLAFPSCGSILRFYSDSSESEVIAEVSASTAGTDVYIPGSTTYYRLFDANRGAAAVSSSFNNWTSYSQQNPDTYPYATYRFIVYAASGSAQSEAAVRAGGLPMTMQLINVQLGAEDAIQRARSALQKTQGAQTAAGDAVDAEGDPAKRLPLLLHSLLSALPYSPDGDTAAACMQVAARLLRRWGASAGDAAASGAGDEGPLVPVDETVQFILDCMAPLDRAHSWLRTLQMSKWSTNQQLPKFVQGMMELMLAAKKGLAQLRLPNVFAEAPSISAVSAGDPAVLGLAPEEVFLPAAKAAPGASESKGASPKPQEEEVAVPDDLEEGEQLNAANMLLSRKGRTAQRQMMQFLQHREGPDRVSLMNLNNGTVLPDFNATGSMSQITAFGADCVLRGGKWYFEIVADRAPSQPHYLQCNFGWATPKFKVNKGSGPVNNQFGGSGVSQLGMDRQGDSWGYCTAQQSYYSGSAQSQLDSKMLGKTSHDMESAPSVQARLAEMQRQARKSQRAAAAGSESKSGAAVGDAAASSEGDDEDAEADMSKMAAMMAAMGAAGSDSGDMEKMMQQMLKSKAGGSKPTPSKGGGFTFQRGSVVGCCADLDRGTFSWVLGGVHHPPAFEGVTVPETGVVPAMTLYATQGSDHGVTVNFGRTPFVFEPPAGYLPVESSKLSFSTWLPSFEHAADVTRKVYLREELPQNIVTMALNEEGCAGEPRALPMEFVTSDNTAQGSYPMENMLNDDRTQFAAISMGGAAVHVVLRVAPHMEDADAEEDDGPKSAKGSSGSGKKDSAKEDREAAGIIAAPKKESAGVVLSRVELDFSGSSQYGQYPLEGLMFAAQDEVRDFNQFGWVSRFTDKHFDAFSRKKQKEAIASASAGQGSDDFSKVADAASAALRTPKPHEPVAHFMKKAQQNVCSVNLAVPVNAKYIVLRFFKPNTASLQASSYYYGGNINVMLNQVRVKGVLAEHPLADVFGSPAFVAAADKLMAGMRAHALSNAVQWTAARDASLVELAQSEATKRGVTPADFDAVMLTPTAEDLMRFDAIRFLPLEAIQARFAIIKYLNRLVVPLLNYVDVSTPPPPPSAAEQLATMQAQTSGDEVAVATTGAASAASSADESLSSVVHRLKGMYFTSTKMAVLESMLEATSGKAKPDPNQGGFGFQRGWEGGRNIRISVNRLRASNAKEDPESDPEGLKSVFGQVFSALRYGDYSRFRGAGKGDQAWTVDLVGEGSIDVGGAYREIVTMLCEDLQSGTTPLFIRCPNGVNEVGLNREKVILNPSATSPLHMAMYEFVGVMFGISMRTRYALPLDLPSIVWKQISGDALAPSDLDGVDKLCRQALSSMSSMSEADMADMEEVFVTKLSDGSETELKPGGRRIRVNFENRNEFVARVVAARLNEGRAQAAAIRRGFNQVVPLGMLSLFVWHEIELLVCGSPRIDVDLLRKHTTYRSGLSATHPVIRLFWSALHSFSQAERRLFLRFVWGRNRLPTREEDWTSPLSITALHVSGNNSMDDMLPVAHTCFFQLDLPLYTNLDTMCSKLRYAITNCQAIDTDFSANSSAMGMWMD